MAENLERGMATLYQMRGPSPGCPRGPPGSRTFPSPSSRRNSRSWPLADTSARPSRPDSLAQSRTPCPTKFTFNDYNNFLFTYFLGLEYAVRAFDNVAYFEGCRASNTECCQLSQPSPHRRIYDLGVFSSSSSYCFQIILNAVFVYSPGAIVFFSSPSQYCDFCDLHRNSSLANHLTLWAWQFLITLGIHDWASAH